MSIKSSDTLPVDTFHELRIVLPPSLNLLYLICRITISISIKSSKPIFCWNYGCCCHSNLWSSRILTPESFPRRARSRLSHLTANSWISSETQSRPLTLWVRIFCRSFRFKPQATASSSDQQFWIIWQC